MGSVADDFSRDNAPDIVEATGAGCFTLRWDEEQMRFVFYHVNTAFPDMLGIPAKYLLHRAIREALPITLIGDFEASCELAFQRHESVTHRLCYRYDRGESWFLIQLTPLDPASGFKGLVGICTDITRLMQADSAISYSETLDRYLTIALDRFRDPILLCQKLRDRYSVVHANAAFKDRIGYAAAEVAGRDPFFMLFRKSKEAFEGCLAEVSRGGKAVSKKQEVYNSQGRPTSMWVSFEPIEDNDKEGLSGIRIRIVCPRPGEDEKHWDKPPVGYSARDQRAALADVANGVINDFNNLLTVILGNIDIFTSGSGRVAMQSMKFARRAMQTAGDVLLDLFDNDKTAAHVQKPGTRIEPAGRDFQGTQRMRIKSGESSGFQDAHGEVVMVVEDEKLVNQMMIGALRRGGYSPLSASCGKEALHMISEMKADPAAIVVDYGLPDMNGLDLIHSLREARTESSFLMVTGYLQDTLALELKGANIAGLYKPFDVDQFLTAVGRILSHPGDVKKN